MEASLGGGNRRTQRRGRPTAIRQEHIRNTTQDDNRQNLLQVQDAEDQAKKILDDALKIKDEKDSIVAEKQRQIEDWINEQEFVTEEDFFEYAMNDVIKPGIKKYNKLYEDPASDHHLFHKGILACKLFNPFFIKDASTNVLLLLIDQLKFFGPGFKEFSTDYFIEGLKNELATLETVVKSLTIGQIMPNRNSTRTGKIGEKEETKRDSNWHRNVNVEIKSRQLLAGLTCLTIGNRIQVN